MNTKLQNLIINFFTFLNKKVTNWTATAYESYGDSLSEGRINTPNQRECLDNYFVSLLAFAELEDLDSFFRVKEKFDENHGSTYDPSLRDRVVLERAPAYLPKKDSLRHYFLKEQLGNYSLYESLEQLLNQS